MQSNSKGTGKISVSPNLVIWVSAQSSEAELSWSIVINSTLMFDDQHHYIGTRQNKADAVKTNDFKALALSVTSGISDHHVN
jgi:hypothetical protein